jgi:RNA-directed DNA polymerase
LGTRATGHHDVKGESANSYRCEAESTNALYWDEVARSSEEAFVMNVERRGSVKLSEGLFQLNVLQEETKLQTKSFIINRWQVYEAYRRVKANAGSAGIDKQSLADFEVNLKDNLYTLWNRKSSGSYFPSPVKAVAIPKKSGGERLLGIPMVTGRENWP